MRKLLSLLGILLISVTNQSCSTLNGQPSTVPVKKETKERVFYKIQRVCYQAKVSYLITANSKKLIIPTLVFCTEV